MATHYGIVRGGKMIKEMTADELEASCPTFVAIQTKEMEATKLILNKKYTRVEFDEEKNFIRVYEAKNPEEIVNYLYKNKIIVNEVRTDKIGLEEYYINLMNKKEVR